MVTDKRQLSYFLLLTSYLYKPKLIVSAEFISFIE